MRLGRWCRGLIDQLAQRDLWGSDVTPNLIAWLGRLFFSRRRLFNRLQLIKQVDDDRKTALGLQQTFRVAGSMVQKFD